jgi:hypothetical protein
MDTRRLSSFNTAPKPKHSSNVAILDSSKIRQCNTADCGHNNVGSWFISRVLTNDIYCPHAPYMYVSPNPIFLYLLSSSRQARCIKIYVSANILLILKFPSLLMGVRCQVPRCLDQLSRRRGRPPRRHRHQTGSHWYHSQKKCRLSPRLDRPCWVDHAWISSYVVMLERRILNSMESEEIYGQQLSGIRVDA